MRKPGVLPDVVVMGLISAAACFFCVAMLRVCFTWTNWLLQRRSGRRPLAIAWLFAGGLYVGAAATAVALSQTTSFAMVDVWAVGIIALFAGWFVFEVVGLVLMACGAYLLRRLFRGRVAVR